MVLLVVKGTRYPDVFTVQRTVTDSVAGEPSTAADDGGEAKDRSTDELRAGGSGQGGRGVAWEVCHIQNSRHHLRLILLSAQELADQLSATTALTEAQHGALDEYKQLIAAQTALLKDAATPVEDVYQFDRAADALRELTTQLYPAHCTKPDFQRNKSGEAGGAATEREAVIQDLYAKHDNPDLDEDERLVVYHCRAILDPQWKANEEEDTDTAGLWFCGKLMTGGVLGDHCGRNERSKVTVKVGPRAGPAPSGEPRMSYEDQRALHAHMRQRREAYRHLEESELRDAVVRQSRGRVAMPTAATAGGGGGVSEVALRMAQLRPLCPRREERILSE